jgi:glycosyltransferase involved in cell wall biosynthesis
MAAPLKVLFITHNYPRAPGDFAGVFLHLLARKIRENGFEVYVVAPHDAAVPEYEEFQGIKVYRFRYGPDEEETLAYRGEMHGRILKNPIKVIRLAKFLRAAYRLSCRIIKQEEISLVSVHWVVPNGIIGYLLSRKYGSKIKLLLCSHGTDVRLLAGIPLVYSAFRPAIRKAKGWTVVSSYLKELISARDRAAADKIRVIPLPNDENVFYPEEGTLEDPNLVVAVSRLTSQKRLSLLLDAVKIVARSRPEIKLEIYGVGPERIRLEEHLQNIGLAGRAKILKPLPQQRLRTVYNRAAVVVLNSVGEGFGLALTEAMLCGTAVIGTRSGGITDIIDDRETGLLVSPDNVQELADRISRLLEDRTLRERLANAGYRKAREHFTSRSSAERYADLLRTL